MDAEDWAFIRKFCLIALAVTVALAVVIMYFHSTADPVTPSTSSRTSRVVSYETGNTVELFDSTTLQQQKIAAARTNAMNSSTTNNDDSSNEGLFTFFLIACMLGGVGVYMARGGKPIYMRRPWQTF